MANTGSFLRALQQNSPGALTRLGGGGGALFNLAKMVGGEFG